LINHFCQTSNGLPDVIQKNTPDFVTATILLDIAKALNLRVWSRSSSQPGRQMRSIAITLVVLFASCPAIAEIQIKRVEILDYGIYSVDVKSSRRDNQGISQNISTNVRLAKATTTVPAEKGVEFGVRYKLDGAPVGATVSLREVTIVPSPGLQPPTASQPIYTSTTVTKSKIGEVSFSGYRLDDPWELLPGVWVIQLWYGDRKVAEQNFTVTAPGGD
jgi:hypothetical protein